MPDVLFLQDLDAMDWQCGAPDCASDHDSLWLVCACHPDGGMSLTMRDTGPRRAIITLWCGTCEAGGLAVAVSVEGHRWPPCPHAEAELFDVLYREGTVLMRCHSCHAAVGQLPVDVAPPWGVGAEEHDL